MWPLRKKNSAKGSFGYSQTPSDSTALAVLGIELVLISLFVVIIFGVLNYLSIFPLSTLNPKLFGWLPTNNKSQAPIDFNKRSNLGPTPFTAPLVKIFTCPVTSIFCNGGISTKFENNPAMLYKVSEGSIAKTLSFYVLESKPYSAGDLKGFSQTFIYNNNCYTASYLFPSDAKLETIKEVPFGSGLPLATLGKQSYKNGANEGNVFIQLQKRKLAKPLIAKHEVESCELLTMEKKDYGSYENLNFDYFNRQP